MWALTCISVMRVLYVHVYLIWLSRRRLIGWRAHAWRVTWGSRGARDMSPDSLRSNKRLITAPTHFANQTQAPLAQTTLSRHWSYLSSNISSGHIISQIWQPVLLMFLLVRQTLICPLMLPMLSLSVLRLNTPNSALTATSSAPWTPSWCGPRFSVPRSWRRSRTCTTLPSANSWDLLGNSFHPTNDSPISSSLRGWNGSTSNSILTTSIDPRSAAGRPKKNQILQLSSENQRSPLFPPAQLHQL